MARLYFNRVAFDTATTGVGTVDVGSAVDNSFLTPTEAGAQDADTDIPYLIEDGTDFEVGLGTFNTGSPNTFVRDTVIVSKISGTAGTSKISLSGSATVRFVLDAGGATTFAKLDAANNFADNTIQRANLLDYGEIINTIGDFGGGTQDIDLELGNVILATVSTSAVTFTVSNPTASGKACSFTLFLTDGGSQTVNYPASFDWGDAGAPVLLTNGLDIIVGTTVDGGTSYQVVKCFSRDDS